MVMVYQRILRDGLVQKRVLHLIQIGQQVMVMVVVIQTVQYLILQNATQLFRIEIDGFGYR
jgi:hypothetical protein